MPSGSILQTGSRMARRHSGLERSTSELFLQLDSISQARHLRKGEGSELYHYVWLQKQLSKSLLLDPGNQFPTQARWSLLLLLLHPKIHLSERARSKLYSF